MRSSLTGLDTLLPATAGFGQPRGIIRSDQENCGNESRKSLVANSVVIGWRFLTLLHLHLSPLLIHALQLLDYLFG